MKTLHTRPLGRTGVEVTELALGGLYVNERLGTPRDEAIRVVHRALELGINYIDTAPLYGNSQELLGEALDGRGEPYLLGTKCGRWNWQKGPYRELDAFKRQFAESLAHLRRDRVDILYVHEADWAVYWRDMPLPRASCHVEAEQTYDYASAPVAEFLRWVRQQKLARWVGLSGNNAHLLAKVLRECDLEVDVVLVAFQYSLIWRNAARLLLPVAEQRGVGVVLGAPLQQGRLAVPNEQWLSQPPDWMDEDLRRRFAALYDIVRETGLPLPELAIRFLLADGRFATVIPGAASVAQLEQNVRAATEGPLPRDLQDRLQALGKVFAGVHGKDY